NPLMLYRIPRTLLTGGVRALGRLALMDHYTTIVQRLRDELKACSRSTALANAAKNTGLTLRSNRPRVVLATHLAGGTGSGMFIDLAYLTHDVLRSMGHAAATTDGLLWLPGADGRSEKPTPLANTVAALHELNHFSASPEAGSKSKVPFQADHGDPEGVLADAGPPFQRCFFLPASIEEGKESLHKATELAGGYLFGNLVTPLGRSADACRTKILSSEMSHHSPLTSYHSFGMYRFSWPKRLLIQQVARRLCGKLIERWVRQVTPSGQEVRTWLSEQWSKRQLEPLRLVARLEEACEKTW